MTLPGAQLPLVEMPRVGAREAALTGVSNPVKRFFKLLGPGLITGAADDDPSGIGTYAVAGAAFGFATLWTALLTLPLMATIQFMCAKIGLVTGQGLAGVLRTYYSRKLLYPAVVALALANTLNAGADIGAIAAAVNLLLPLPVAVLILPSGLVLLALQVWGSYRLISTVFKWLTLALFAYIGAALLAHPNVGEVLRGTFLPTIQWNSAFLMTLVAILGTTISPYLFFWQASHEVEEQVSRGKRRPGQIGTSEAEFKYVFWDVNIGVFLSNLVMYFIIFATGATLFQAGKTDIQSAAEAAEALRPLAGDAAGILMAVGLVGTGLLAVPILTGSTASALTEAVGWHSSLNAKPSQAKQFYLLVILSMLIAMAINFVGINPIDALVWTAVINGFLAPPLLIVILLIANNQSILGNRVNGRWSNLMGGAAAVLMSAAAVGLIVMWGK